ncbi:MAG: DUF4232 domain-containing protein [Candidatus Limnocylindria bacterium]
MKRGRIETLLRSQPPDEPDYRGALDLDREPLDRPGATRVRRGAVVAAIGATAMLAVVIGLTAGRLASNRSEPSSSMAGAASATPHASLPAGVISWIDATPAPSPTPGATARPDSLPSCSARALALVASGWSGATGSLAGGALVVNVSSEPCRVAGKPAVGLLDATGAVVARGGAAEPGTAAEAVALPPGGVAVAAIVWTNWCAAAPPSPLSLRLDLPNGGGQLSAPLRAIGPIGGGSVPRCDAPGAASTIGVPIPFAPPEPSAGGYQPRACAPAQLTAFAGKWLSNGGTSWANLVIVNFGGGPGGFDCRLPTSPVLELRDARGRLLATAEPMPPAGASVVLPPGWAAVTQIGFANWCSAPPSLPLHLNLVVSGSRVDVIARSTIHVPGCMSGSQAPPPIFAYGNPMTLPGTNPPTPDSCDPALPLSVGLSALPSVRPGGTLIYTVTLTNRSAYDKILDPGAFCPSYTERLFLPGSGTSLETRLALNWPSGASIPRGATATFEMRLKIPADAPPGTATLVWQLGKSGPAAKATFKIES